MAKSPEDTGRDHGRFRAGTSGNPRGRPKGARNKATLVLAELVDQEGEVIIRKLVDRAKAGEDLPLRLCVERLLPRLEHHVEVDLRRVETAGDVAAAVSDVIALAAGGDLSIEEAKQFLALIEVERRAIETHELAVRLEVLEESTKHEEYK